MRVFGILHKLLSSRPLTRSKPHMESKLRPYICSVNDSLASIMVDLGLDGHVPMQSKPWLLWIWVAMLAPRADGLSSTEEMPKLCDIEDALIGQLGPSVGAIFCGRITTLNRREFYFYGETSERFTEIVQAVMQQFSGYKFELGVKHDPKWVQYSDVLYPGPEDLEQIANGDVLDVLAARGDKHAIPRKVDHWAYFSTSRSRSQFIKAALERGFSIDSEHKVEGKLHFCTCLSKVQSIEPQEIDKTSIELLHLVQAFDGEYTGWEAALTTEVS